MDASPAATLRVSADTPARESWPPIDDQCPIGRTLDVVATRSAFLLLREAFYGATRFDQFTDRAQISDPVAAARLRELVTAGLMEKVPYREPGQRTRAEYHLTAKGADLLPALLALFDWGDRWTFAGGARIGLRHAGCGAPVHAALTCADGHPVSASEIELHRRR